MTPKTTIVFRNATGWNVRFTGNQAQLMRELTGTDAAPLPFDPSASLFAVAAHLRTINPTAIIVVEHA